MRTRNLAVMDTRAPVERPGPVASDRRLLERLWLATAMLGLALTVFAQSAGNAATDTKLDLVVSPLRFLRRSLHLWDPIGNAGQLQNQAYGYLFPIGPFYGVLHATGMQPWVMQRAFESVIVCTAFLGTYRLARRMGVDRFGPALGAGLAYALAPRMLSELTSISAELMPVAALPWVLLPLVDGARGGSPRRAAARSGVALVFAGGVNAAAVVAILPVPALWLLTRSPGPRRRALMGWWSVAVGLACAWWAIPLVLLGRYSPPFLDWIESSSTTTIPTSLLGVLRGVDHWEAYLGPGIWPGGWILVTGRAAILATTAVAALGLAGMSLRRTPHALFLWACLLLGLVALTAGHLAPVGPPGALTMQRLLDGALVPFRNLHKFDPVVRLPIALGVGHALLWLSGLRERRVVVRGQTIRLPVSRFAFGVVAALGAVAIAPVWGNHLVSSQRVTPEPSWWASAGHWLQHHSHGGRALVVPGSASPVYVWGGTVDDALQPVATTPWTVRGAVPLTQAGYTRLLDAVEQMLATGTGSPDLAPLLARAGIGYVVLANDLQTGSSQATPLLYVRASLDGSPGLRLRAGFGPRLGGSLNPAVSIDAGGSTGYPAVQVYSVAGGDSRAALQPLTSAVAATGSSDALPQLVSRGLSPDQPVLFGDDRGDLPVARSVTTDGIRKREASFAGSLTPSATMAEDQPYAQRRPHHDYLPDGHGALSAYRYEGIAGVSASSSGAAGLAFLNRSQHNGPWSALDDDVNSAWQSTGFGAVGQWLEVRFDHKVEATTARIRFGQVDDGPAPMPVRVLISTDAGNATQTVLPGTDEQVLFLPRGAKTRLRVTVAAVADGSRGSSVAVRSLTIPGVSPIRTLDVPSAPGSDAFAFDAAPGNRPECLQLSVGTVCDPVYGAAGQEDSGIDRTFTSPAGRYLATARVRIGGGDRLNELLDTGAPIRADASSTGSADPRQRPGAAVDGDPSTTWQAAEGDIQPVLRLSLAEPTRITGLSLVTPATAPVARVLAVTVSTTGPRGDFTWTADVGDDGRVPWSATGLVEKVSIRVDSATIRKSQDSVTGHSRLLAAGIGEVRLDGAPVAQPAPQVHFGCGEAAALEVDGQVVPLSIDADRADLLAGRPVRAAGCGSSALRLAAGTHRVSLPVFGRTIPVSVTLERDGRSIGVPARPGNVHVEAWGPTERSVRVAAGPTSLLVVHENANAGWRATLHGRELRPVRVDGWEQAFVIPAGADGLVHLSYAPQGRFVAGLTVGVLAVVLLIALAYGWRRRRPAAPALSDGYPGGIVVVAACIGLAAVLAGWPGLLTAAAVTAVAFVTGPTMWRWAPLAAAAVLTVAGFVVARAGHATIFVEQNSGPVQLTCIVALTVGALTVARRRRRRSTRAE